MFHWVLNTIFICNTNQLASFLFDTNFYKKVFCKQAIENWILILIITQHELKLHAKKHTLNMTKCGSLKKATPKLSS